jgi:predicted dehydrogenase
MKQLIQSYKTGELGLFEVPTPLKQESGILVNTKASLVSAGTEKMIVDIAKKSLLGKAKARPDLVKQVINKMKQEGVKNTLEKVFNKLDSPIPLGYSCAGRVLEVGKNVKDVSVGDRVACGGAGYANHSEINYIPQNLFVKIPDEVDYIDASFVTVGAIALQGVRQADIKLGERVAVIGLGLIGQLTVQLLKANGAKVIGTDLDPSKLNLAKKLGADAVCSLDELITKSNEFSRGYGVDSVIITASTSSNQPILDAGEIAKFKAKVVIVGMVSMDIPRNTYYKKELDVRLSMAYGPGRYDPNYEEKGQDYPFEFVRWTERRNFEAFLELIAEKRVTPKELITHQFEFEQALDAYELMSSKEPYLGIVLNYRDIEKIEKSVVIDERATNSSDINLALIGAGNFTKSVTLPHITKIADFNLLTLCTSTGVSANSVGNKYGFSKITTDSAEIFEDESINSVIVTTRHDRHYSKMIKAINSSKHIFVEKPLCLNIKELEAIKEAYNSSETKRVIQVGFNRRFAPLMQFAKEQVESRNIVINYRINAGIIPLDSWIQDRDVGGGRVVGEVCHFIDSCSFLTGSRVSSVFASCVQNSDNSIPNEDNIVITLNFENGSIATIMYCAYGDRAMPKEHIEIFAPNSSIVLNDFKELTLYQNSTKKRFKNLNQDKGFKSEFEAFRDAIKSGKSAISFDSICNTTETSFKILESIKTKELQKL